MISKECRQDIEDVIAKHGEKEDITDWAICFNHGNSGHTTSYYSEEPNLDMQNGVVYLLNDVINERQENIDNDKNESGSTKIDDSIK